MRLSIQQQQEIRNVVIRTLIQFSLIPDPLTGMFLPPPDQYQIRQFLQMDNGGHSSDARQAEPLIDLSIQEMDTTALSSLIWQLGTLMEEVDIHISSLTKFREQLQLRYGNLVDGVPGRNVVET